MTDNLPTSMENMEESFSQGLALNEEHAPQGKLFLKLDQKAGIFVYGKQMDEVSDGSVWVMDIETLQHGFFRVSKKGGTIDEKRMTPFFGGHKLIRPEPEKDSDWKLGYCADFTCVKGSEEELGVTITYDHCNTGVQMFFGKLCNAIKRQYLADKKRGSEEYCLYPAIVFEVGNPYSYGGNTIYPPQCSVVGWVGKEEKKKKQDDQAELLPWEDNS